MNSHLIANRRPGRTTTVIHIEGVGCAALAQAKYTRPIGEERTLSEVLRNGIAIATAFKQMSICRKCRSAARQRIAIAEKRTEIVEIGQAVARKVTADHPAIQAAMRRKRATTASAPKPEVKTVPLVIEMASTARYASVHHKGCRTVKDPMDLGRAATVSEIPDLIMDATGWDEFTLDDLTLCLCANTRL